MRKIEKIPTYEHKIENKREKTENFPVITKAAMGRGKVGQVPIWGNDNSRASIQRCLNRWSKWPLVKKLKAACAQRKSNSAEKIGQCPKVVIRVGKRPAVL